MAAISLQLQHCGFRALGYIKDVLVKYSFSLFFSHFLFLCLFSPFFVKPQNKSPQNVTICPTKHHSLNITKHLKVTLKFQAFMSLNNIHVPSVRRLEWHWWNWSIRHWIRDILAQATMHNNKHHFYNLDIHVYGG